MDELLWLVRTAMDVCLMRVGRTDPGKALRMVAARDRVFAHIRECEKCERAAHLAILAGVPPTSDAWCAEVVESVAEFGTLGRSVLGDDFPRQPATAGNPHTNPN